MRAVGSTRAGRRLPRPSLPLHDALAVEVRRRRVLGRVLRADLARHHRLLEVRRGVEEERDRQPPLAGRVAIGRRVVQGVMPRGLLLASSFLATLRHSRAPRGRGAPGFSGHALKG